MLTLRVLHGKEEQHATNPDHMPKDHKQFIDFNKESVLEWAEAAGTHILKTVESLLAAYRTEQQGLVKLADKHSIARVEKSCERALSYTPRPALRNVQTILKTGQDKLTLTDHKPIQSESFHGFIRGAAYYGGKRP